MISHSSLTFHVLRITINGAPILFIGLANALCSQSTLALIPSPQQTEIGSHACESQERSVAQQLHIATMTFQANKHTTQTSIKMR